MIARPASGDDGRGDVVAFPATPGDRGTLVAAVVRLCRALRRRGVAVGGGETITAVRALECVPLDDRVQVQLALRTVLVGRVQELALFDEVFEEVWGAPRRAGGLPQPDLARPRAAGASPEPPPSPELPSGRIPGRRRALALEKWLSNSEADESEPAGIPLASPGEALGEKDFAEFTAQELDAVTRVAARLARRLAARPGRRWRAAPRGARVDARRTMRRALRTGGEPVELARRERKPRRIRLVLLCDVSGSMDLYARFLLQFLYALQNCFARVETFVFATRLSRITEQLRGPSYRSALDRLARDVRDWSGGTRIGAALAEFHARWARLLDRRTIVVVLSDGWDTGDPAELAGALQAFGRRAGKVIWLNPLLGSPSYQPLTRGMQAALPHVDVFAPAHNLESLEKLVQHLRL